MVSVMSELHSDPSPPCQRSAHLLAHRPLVSKIAWRMVSRLPASVELDDLMQAGMIGLNDALARFDASRGASFDTYAARRIEGAMLDALRANDTLSRDARARLRQARAAVHRLEQRLQRAPRAQEVANELGWTLKSFHDCLVDAGAAGARCGEEDLDRLDDEVTLDDEALAVVDEHADPARTLQQRQRHAALNAAFSALEEKERRLMELLYVRGVNQHEASASLGVSPSRISRMHDEVLVKLKRRLRDW